MVVVRTPGTGFATSITARDHEWVADEPEKLKGTDTGPTPYELLLSSLGACTSITLTMYAQRKGWPLDNVEVQLSHSRVHAEDCEVCETQTGRVDLIDRAITLFGDLSDDQRNRLIDIANKCPVARTLNRQMVIQTTLVDAS